MKLTTPTINCAQATSVSLSYWRWLGVGEPWQPEKARVQISVDSGTTWQTLWENSSVASDSSWTEMTHDLTSIAAGKADVRVRWTLGPTGQGGWCGWNIDDVTIDAVLDCGNANLVFTDGFESGSCTKWAGVTTDE